MPSLRALPQPSRFRHKMRNWGLLSMLGVMLFLWFRDTFSSPEEFRRSEASGSSSNRATSPPWSPDKRTILEGKIISVADGDTVTILDAQHQKFKIRLQGIDAPEDQQEYGNQSRRALASMIAGKQVQVRQTGTDRYGRVLGWIFLNGIDINRQMVAEGWAWHYLEYNQEADITRLQRTAQSQSLGLWQSPNSPVPPWEYRSLKRNGFSPTRPLASAPSLPSQSLQSGNSTNSTPAATSGQTDHWINANGSVRHNRSCRWFGRTARGYYGRADEGRPCGICKG